MYNGVVMSTEQRREYFSFSDLPGTLWYFLGEERWTFLGFSGVLLTVLCYTMVPPYIVGRIANLLIEFMKAGPGAPVSTGPLLRLVGVLSGSYAIVALVRLSSKRMLGRMSL